MRRRASAWIAVAGALVAGEASASPSYPAALKADLDLYYTPGCDLCHQANTPPVGPADTPFAKSMEARGLVGNDDDASVASALVKMRADGVDSDGDGAEDLDELSWGGDPNHADLPVGGPETPVLYGCACSTREGGGLPGGVVLSALAGVAAARRRRRRSVSGARR